MELMGMTTRTRSGATAFLVVALLWVSGAAQGATLDWANLDPGWDDLDTSGQQVFVDVDGSEVDVAVSYTDNMFDRNSVPNLYTAATAPSSEIIGTLRFTNDRVTLLETAITITFSEDVFISDLGTVSLSTIQGIQENLVVEAFDGSGNAVLASAYGTNTTGLVELDTDGDAAYRTRGLGAQESSLYGDAFFAYSDSAVRELRYSLFSTLIGGDDIVLGLSSQGIKNIDFDQDGIHVVPEPSTAFYLGLGLLALGRRSTRRK
jgi:hypothetical protein